MKQIFVINNNRKPRSFEVWEDEFYIRKVAYLPVEGIGINGSFAIKGRVTVRGNRLYITAKGYSSPMKQNEHSGSFQFFGTATLLKDGNKIIRKNLRKEQHGIWSNDGFSPIGTAQFELLAFDTSDTYTIEIEASYIYSSANGSVVPSPQFARETLKLENIQ